MASKEAKQQSDTNASRGQLSSDEKSAELLTQVLERTLEFTPLGEADPIKLSNKMAMRYFAKPTKSGRMPSEDTVTQFLMTCKARKLNPWVGDAFLTGFDTNDGPQFSCVTAYQALAKRAELHEQYDGIEYGIIVEVDNTIEQREGTFKRLHEDVVGAWARVFRKDKSHPYFVSIDRPSFDKQKSLWQKMPGWMLAKCAKAAAMREAFPNETGGMYITEEMTGESEVPLPSRVTPSSRQAVVTASDLTRQPSESEQPTKQASELSLSLRRCQSVDEVNDVRSRTTAQTQDEEQFDLINLACDQRIKQLLEPKSGGQLFETTANAAEQ